MPSARLLVVSRIEMANGKRRFAAPRRHAINTNTGAFVRAFLPEKRVSRRVKLNSTTLFQDENARGQDRKRPPRFLDISRVVLRLKRLFLTRRFVKIRFRFDTHTVGTVTGQDCYFLTKHYVN